jgi:hypothetical protein
MRVTAAKPHWRAISVAFDDQGEMVPRRGVTSFSAPRFPRLFEQRRELPPLGFAQCLPGGDEVPVLDSDDAHPRYGGRNALLQALQAKRRKRGGSAEKQEIDHGGLQRRAGEAALKEGRARDGAIIADPRGAEASIAGKAGRCAEYSGHHAGGLESHRDPRVATRHRRTVPTARQTFCRKPP